MTETSINLLYSACTFLCTSSSTDNGYGNMLSYGVFLLIMIIFGVLVNMIAMMVYLQNPPSNTFDWLVFYITVSDLISCLAKVMLLCLVYELTLENVWNNPNL
jgi:hypothetical protein